MSSSTTQVKKAMISSTARDLPVHRKQVEEACHRMSVFAEKMMENLTAEDANAIEVSLRLVNEADVYIGIFAHRYGSVPDYDNPDGISVTEMEYNRAVERGIPRLIFFIHDDHDLKKSDVETGPGAEKLERLKKRIGKERVAAFFKNPEDLRAHVVQALDLQKEKWKAGAPDTPTQFHSVVPMTLPPESYIAHPYVLSQTTGLIGRRPELNLLTDWITGKRGLGSVRIFNVIAIGGMGKSALTWEWFSNIAPLEWPGMAGRFWWSFYESDAYFENFVIRALAYVSRSTPDEVRKIPAPERETALLHILDQEPHLLVLDGLERILIAYARMDAAHLVDDEYDERTANFMAQARGLNDAEKETFLAGHRLRKTADPRAGQFLKKLSRVKASRILVSSRLYPFDLQMLTGDPLPGCFAIFLQGLSDDDALDLWHSFGVSGARDELLPLFQTFDKHPLLLQALAGEVAHYRAAPGGFVKWRVAKKDFNPFGLPLVQAKSHVLLHAMRGLSETEQKALHTIAALRIPLHYEALKVLLVREEKKSIWKILFGKSKLLFCENESELDFLLQNFEDRGLVSWDKRANRYDMHPVVRGIVWTKASESDQQNAFVLLNRYFGDAPRDDNWEEVNTLEELTPAIELYYSLIGLKQYDFAAEVYMNRMWRSVQYRLGKLRLQVELLEKLFPDGVTHPPRVSNELYQAHILNEMGSGYLFSGEPQKSISFYERDLEILEKYPSNENLSTPLYNLTLALFACGKLKKATLKAIQVRELRREQIFGQMLIGNDFDYASILKMQGLLMASLGEKGGSIAVLKNALQNFTQQNHIQMKGVVCSYLAQYALWFDSPLEAKSYAYQSWELAQVHRNERDFARAACRQGQAALGLGDFDTAAERLHHALTRARAINLAEEELPALIALAELRRRQGKPEEAREHLDDVWEAAERGPYPLFHADACNVLCQLERDAGNTEKAIEAATQAYRLAWCDGPPWAYHYGLENAKKHLRELGAPFPEMPPSGSK